MRWSPLGQETAESGGSVGHVIGDTPRRHLGQLPLLSTYCVLGTLLDAPHVPLYLIIAPCGRGYYYLHFMFEDTKA